ncbi:hypothetical protein [Salidesulfovibrio onnuriiensis]|uniref:hypothetical protein n=1 Tax=Salidesulfovibrio onnuriiensis TaxID=2583823 RepID=UPI00164FDD6F|nr:hypothetical protein [Salidesulfovibrio onnuriiensis]
MPLESLYDPRLMRQAQQTYTVGESHASIIRSAEVAALVNTIVSGHPSSAEYNF